MACRTPCRTLISRRANSSAHAQDFDEALAGFHIALQEEDAPGVLRHVLAMRQVALPSDGSGPSGGVPSSEEDADAALRCELHGACVTKARAWVEQRTQQLVAQFHLRWHEDADLLGVDAALRESMELVRDAEIELGALPVASEVLEACEQQQRQRLATHVRSANRHVLRVLFADFCQWEERRELQRLCLDKYREHVDRYVQSEAVAAQMKLLATLDGGGGGGGGGGGTTVDVLDRYLEGIAELGAELRDAELPEQRLPDAFVSLVLREVEREACTQVSMAR